MKINLSLKIFGWILILSVIHLRANPESLSDSDDRMARIASNSSEVFLMRNADQLRRNEQAAWKLEGDNTKIQISDNIAILQAWLLKDPSLREQALKRAMKMDLDPQGRRTALYGLQMHPGERISQLRSEDQYNRTINTFNNLSRTGMDLITLNLQGLAGSFVNLLFFWEPMLELTPRQREALDEYVRNRDEYSAEIAQWGNYASRIEQKLHDQRVQDELQKGDWHMEHRNWDEARQAYANARILAPENGSAEKGQLKAAASLSAQARAREKSLEVQSSATSSAASETVLYEALAEGEKSSIDKAASDCFANASDAGLKSCAAFATTAVKPIALAQSQSGWRIWRRLRPAGKNPRGGEVAMAKTSREDYVAYLSTSKTAGARASAILDSADDANPAAAVCNAQKIYNKDWRRFIFLGRKDNHISPRSDTPPGQTPLHQMMNPLSIFLPIDWAMRAVQAAFTNPVSDEPWRSAAVRYLDHASDERNPFAPEDKALARKLAQSYERIGRYNRAQTYYAMAGLEDAAIIARLDGKSARQLVQNAKTSADPEQRRAVLEMAVQRFGSTSAGKKAKELLQEMENDKSDLCWVSKKDLIRWPGIWLGQGLNLPKEWFDGAAGNGEIADDGIHFLKPDGSHVRFKLRVNGRKESRKMELGAQALEEIKEPLREWQREKDAAERSKVILERPRLQVDLEGSAGIGGVGLYPRLMPLPFNSDRLPLFRSDPMPTDQG